MNKTPIPEVPVVYLWHNIIEDCYYIGQTYNAKKRYNNFIKWDKSYGGKKINEYRAKYPSLEFWEYHIICEIPRDENMNDTLNALETALILKFTEHKGIEKMLNTCRGGDVINRIYDGDINAYNRDYYHTSEKFREYKKEYEKTSKRRDYHREYQRDYYQKSEKYKEYQREYQKSEKYREYQREYQRKYWERKKQEKLQSINN